MARKWSRVPTIVLRNSLFCPLIPVAGAACATTVIDEEVLLNALPNRCNIVNAVFWVTVTCWVVAPVFQTRFPVLPDAVSVMESPTQNVP